MKDHYLLIENGTQQILTSREAQRLYQAGVIYSCGDTACAADYHLHDGQGWPAVDFYLNVGAHTG